MDIVGLDSYPSCWSCNLDECTGTNGEYVAYVSHSNSRFIEFPPDLNSNTSFRSQQVQNYYE